MTYNDEQIFDKLKKAIGNNSITEEDLSKLLESDSLTYEEVKNILKVFSDFRLKLSEHMKLDKVIFLFGNGASIYAGSKDTRNFNLSVITKKSSYCDIDDIISKINGMGIEDQLNALITIRTYFKIMQDVAKEEIVKQLIEDIKRNLIDNFVNSVDYERLKLHEIFLFKLRSLSCLLKSSIYTPNYDLAFEYVMDSLRIEYKDGFTGFVNRVFDARTFMSKDKVTLVKLHGSVNWKIDGQKIKEVQPLFSSGKVQINDAASVLIYPTSNKLYQTYATPYSELMRYMLNEMEVGKNVIIVLGYKYGDEHINEILLKALENPYNIYYFFIYDPNDKNDFIDNICSLSDSMPNINLLCGKIWASFNTFVKYLMPATAEKTDQEKVLELLKKVLTDDSH